MDKIWSLKRLLGAIGANSDGLMSSPRFSAVLPFLLNCTTSINFSSIRYQIHQHPKRTKSKTCPELHPETPPESVDGQNLRTRNQKLARNITR